MEFSNSVLLHPSRIIEHLMYFRNSHRGYTIGCYEGVVQNNVIKANIHILLQSVTKMSSLQSNLHTDISSQESLLLITETSFPV